MTTLRPAAPVRVCLVTTGHPSTNPRLVKEADALSAAGYTVHVVACKFLGWADRADAEFEARPWTIGWVRFGALASRVARTAMRLRKRLNLRLVETLGYRPALAERALHYMVPELATAARSWPADLYVAHNLAALPAAAHAARAHNARLGFDAEDFHRGEFPDAEVNTAIAELTRWAESYYIPQCDYVTAASDGIARAYADALDIPLPTTVSNVFQRADAEVAVPASELEREKEEGTESIYWFSQTIGAGRGLDDALEALPSLEDHIVLSLRGQWAEDYREAFMARAKKLGVAHRVRTLDPVPPGELIRRTAEHDIGLALEQPHTLNRSICVTNKIFSYLVAGVPVVATDTVGQRGVCEHIPGATRVVPPGDAGALAEAVASLARSDEAVTAAQRAAERYNWEVEQRRFLDVVAGVLETRGLHETSAPLIGRNAVSSGARSVAEPS